MGFFSSRIELNNTIKKLEAEIEALKADVANKSGQIAELNKKNTSLSQKNTEYEKKYINTNLECDFCYTTIQKDFAFCPKCGRKIEKAIPTTVQSTSSSSIFKTEQDLDSLLINQYNGFNDKKIVIPSSINDKPIIGIWNSVFEKCVDIEEVIFEEGCKYIGKNAFCGCQNLKKIRLPKSLIEIGDNAFSNCTSLEEIAIPPNVKVIGKYAFSGCKNIRNIILPENLKYISDGMLSHTAITDIKIPQSVLHIGYYAFAYTAIKELELPCNLYSIGNRAFQNTSLSKIIIHSNVKIIEREIFDNAIPPTIYCASGSKALLYARKHSLNCVEIPAQKPANVDICISSIILVLGTVPKVWSLSHWQQRLGVYKASTWSWECPNIFRLDIEKNMDINEARQLESKLIQHTYADNYNPALIGHRQELSLCKHWGNSDV